MFYVLPWSKIAHKRRQNRPVFKRHGTEGEITLPFDGTYTRVPAAIQGAMW